MEVENVSRDGLIMTVSRGGARAKSTNRAFGKGKKGCLGFEYSEIVVNFVLCV